MGTKKGVELTEKSTSPSRVAVAMATPMERLRSRCGEQNLDLQISDNK